MKKMTVQIIPYISSNGTEFAFSNAEYNGNSFKKYKYFNNNELMVHRINKSSQGMPKLMKLENSL